MKLSGSAELHAPMEQVYAAIADPSMLVRTIPGCQQLETVGADDYRMTITAGVASIRGTYLGSVHIVDQDPPNGYTLKASGSSAAGTIDATAKITLAPNGGGTTHLEYDADAVVGGAIGGVGQRMLTGVARKLAGEFFTAVDHELSAPSIPVSVTPEEEVPGAAPGVFRRPEPVRQPPTGIGDPRLLLAAFALGALATAVGVALGARTCHHKD
jgi:uncharacterized protein